MRQRQSTILKTSRLATAGKTNNNSVTVSPTIVMNRKNPTQPCDERISPLNLPHDSESAETISPPQDMYKTNEESDREAASVLMALNVISRNSPSATGTNQKRKLQYLFEFSHEKENV